MRVQLSAATLVLFHLTLAHGAVHTLNMRTSHIEPITPTPDDLDASSPNPNHPYFMIDNFEAFMAATSPPNTSSPSTKQWSRTCFDVTLVTPEPEDRWRVRCWKHTSGALCTPDTWSRCGNATFVNGTAVPNQEDEEMWWRFGEGLSKVELMRNWVYTAPSVEGQPPQTMHMTTTASEDANWVENGAGKNVTVSPMGKFYQRCTGWVLPWKQAWG